VLIPRNEATDEDLMQRFTRGDRSAFAALVRRHQSPLYNFALRQLRSPPSAEEVVQETFARVVQNAADFRHTARFTAWLYAIARNLCIDVLRKGAIRRHLPLDEPRQDQSGEGETLEQRTADGRPSADQGAAMVQLRERLLSAIEQLPDEQREVFLLREVADLPFREIAAVVGAPENTVKSRMRYALEHLQTALSEFEEYARALR
jgi:RNA polymerase sigma-70 factor (ECF subfamily)